jgi:hypothetical protein
MEFQGGAWAVPEKHLNDTRNMTSTDTNTDKTELINGFLFNTKSKNKSIFQTMS